MRLSELVIAISIFIISSSIFGASFITIRKNILRYEDFSKQSVALLESDDLIRNEIKKIKIPYWKNFEKEAKNQKPSLEEHLQILERERGIKIKEITFVYEKKHNADGIKVEWEKDGKKYTSQEFIKQRIVNE